MPINSLTSHTIFDISPYLSTVRFESEDTIFREGNQTKKLYYLLKGRAKVSKIQENGKTSLLEFLDAPSLIGEMEFLHIRTETINVTAITPCICEVLEISSCKKLLMNDNHFLRFLCEYLGTKAVLNAEKSAIDTSYPLSVRLARFILLTENNMIYREKHTEVAEYLGVSYRHLLYVLADFSRKKILTKTIQGYLISDFNALKKIAGNYDSDRI